MGVDNQAISGYTLMSLNKQSRKYFIGRSYKNDECDWPFDLVGDRNLISLRVARTKSPSGK